MNRAEMDVMVADVMGEHFDQLRDQLELVIERLIERKPLPPFTPPPVWAEGKRYAAGLSVRWRNGLFYAQRDTEGEPAHDDAWVPLLVGIAGIELRTTEDGRTFQCSASLSDGRVISHEQQLAVPIVRGYWNAETTYMPGDRVFRYGEHHALKMSLGIDPTTEDETGSWQKVGGKNARNLSLAVSLDGDITESGRVIGSIKPMVQKLLADLSSRSDAA